MTIKQSSQSLSNNQRFFQLRPLKKTSLWKRLKSAKIGDNRGSVAVEWGLTAPLVILMIVGILEISMVMVVNSFIEGGLREASRYGITGGTAAQNAATRQQRIREIIVENSFGLLDPNLLTISTKVYPSFNMIGDEAYTDSNHNGAYDIGEAYVDRNSNGAWDADSGIEGVGGPSEIVVYRASYNWPLLTGLLNPVMGEHIKLGGAVAVRNEPFPPH